MMSAASRPALQKKQIWGSLFCGDVRKCKSGAVPTSHWKARRKITDAGNVYNFDTIDVGGKPEM
jgi:hypothetical protein